MTLTIELSEEEARLVEYLRARGIDVDAMVKELLAGVPVPHSSESDHRPGNRTIALLDRWAEEDATDDPTELDRRDQDTAELIANLKANRVRFRIPKV